MAMAMAMDRARESLPVAMGADLPVPKRPAKERSEPSLRAPSSAVAAALARAGVSGPTSPVAATANSAQLHMNADLMADLPAPLGPLPRQALPLQARSPSHIVPPRAESAPLPNVRRRSPVPVARPVSAPVVAPVAAAPVAAAAAMPAEIAAPVPKPEPAKVVAEPVASPVVQSVVPAKTGAPAAAKGSVPPSDSTAPEPIETMEHRMYGVVRTPSVKSPEKASGEPAVPPPSVVAAAAPQLVPVPTPVAAAPVAAQLQKAQSNPALKPVIKATSNPQLQAVASPVVAPVAAIKPAAASPKPAPESAPAVTAPTTEPPVPAAGPPEIIESAPDLADTPQLPMGWIIGALFVLALLLTLWIAHRAGAFGPPPGPPIDPNATTLPRMP